MISSIVGTQSALITRDGSIVGYDGVSNVFIPNIGVSDIIVVLRHRNHSVTATAESFDSDGLVMVDFTSFNFIQFGNTSMVTFNGVNALRGGDANVDGAINAPNKNIYWRAQNAGTFDYINTLSDFNLDGGINATDKNKVWRISNGESSTLD